MTVSRRVLLGTGAGVIAAACSSWPGGRSASAAPAAGEAAVVAKPLRSVLSFNCHEPTNLAVLDQAAAAGFGWMRADLTWTRVQPQFPGWRVSRVGKVSAEVAVDETMVHDGAAALRLTNSTAKAPNVYLTFWQTVAVQPNTTYAFTAWVRADDAKGNYLALDRSWSKRLAVPAGSYEWQQLHWEVTTAAEQTSLDLRIVSEDVTGGLWLDDITMTGPDSAENLLTNPGFESAGSYDWSLADQTLGLCAERDLKVLFILDYGNPLFGGNPTSDEGREAFTAFAAAAAERYRGTGTRFEVWNEPHNFGPLSPAEFARLVRETSAAIHAVDPSAIVVSGGLGKFLYDYGAEMVAAGLGDVDAIGIHSYWMSTWGTADRNDAPEEIFTHLANWRDMYGSVVPDVSDHMTEMGPRLVGDAGNDQHTYANLVVRTILTHWMAGFDFVNLYDATDGEFGLFRKDDGGDLRRAVTAIETLSGLAASRRLAGIRTPAPGQPCHMANLVSDDAGVPAVQAVWLATAEESPTVLRIAEGGTVVDLYGRPVELNSQGELTITPSGGVHYVTLPVGEQPSSDPVVSLHPLDSEDRSLVWRGEWRRVGAVGAYRGSVRSSDSRGSAVRTTFTGSRVRIFGPRGVSSGIAEITVDGVSSTVDLWHNNHLDQALLFDSGVLANPHRRHQVEVVVTGEARPAATGTVVALDKITVCS